MKSYFLEIALVRLSAGLLGKELIENYAFHGSLPRFASLELDKLSEADGIEKVPEKGELLNFGALCGRVIQDTLGDLTQEESLYLDAEIARELFLDLSEEKRGEFTDDEIHPVIKTVMESFVKKAQIRTHTAKPGGEDINKWLADYYALQKKYSGYVDVLCREILKPNPKLKDKFKDFFNKGDAIIVLAMTEEPSKIDLKKVIPKVIPRTTFGKMLVEVVKAKYI